MSAHLVELMIIWADSIESLIAFRPVVEMKIQAPVEVGRSRTLEFATTLHFQILGFLAFNFNNRALFC